MPYHLKPLKIMSTLSNPTGCLIIYKTCKFEPSLLKRRVTCADPKNFIGFYLVAADIEGGGPRSFFSNFNN